jgi:hypothetical protein
MFGLMKACSCNKSSEERELQRLHYCGTCKTIGRLYGQKSRIFLNYDAVFLGEILTLLQPAGQQFAPAYVSKSCLALPRRDQIPWALEYAASANVVLARFKLLDHAADTGSKLVSLAARIYSEEFQRASEALARCGFPFEELRAWMSLQGARERDSKPSMESLAEPTAAATRLVFRHGAATAGAPSETTETMAYLGTTFGEIAYLVDAIEDVNKDAESGEFNALSATGMTTEQAGELVETKREKFLDHLAALPIDPKAKRNFASRLESNLQPLLFMGRRPDRVVYVQRRRGPSFCGDCANAICCCEAIQCGDCCASCCCDSLCMGCGILR